MKARTGVLVLTVGAITALAVTGQPGHLLDENPPVQGVRVSLDDLLSAPADGRADPDVWSPWEGHQERRQRSGQPAGGDRD